MAAPPARSDRVSDVTPTAVPDIGRSSKQPQEVTSRLGHGHHRKSKRKRNSSPNNDDSKDDYKQTINKNIKDGACFRCGASDHFVRDCPAPRQRGKSKRAAELTLH
ncbi:hypothetical protein K458DRAFT_431896 [Lentithecium fluviatile CBS 122367]|uniref:CCHC-type domain-containing protein n=1 Tax=Lentithecium fluviatile CBS 122367 TaxID=1168545 RepID=A0A6G1IZJ7_9PLEO|nr:hypothetical protein K458DRAFT_431896 [Lentithecium fluviatile CBS 122367]